MFTGSNHHVEICCGKTGVFRAQLNYPVFSRKASLPSRCTTFFVPEDLAVLTFLRRCSNIGFDEGFAGL